MSRLRGITISAQFSGDEARLTVRTGAHDVDDARILSDELWTFVSSAASRMRNSVGVPGVTLDRRGDVQGILSPVDIELRPRIRSEDRT